MNIRVKNPDTKKKHKKVNSTLQHVRTDFKIMTSEERPLSFMTEAPIIQKSIH